MCNSTTSRLVRPPVHLILNSVEKFIFFAQGEPSNSSESFRFVGVPLAGVSLLDKIDFSSLLRLGNNTTSRILRPLV